MCAYFPIYEPCSKQWTYGDDDDYDDDDDACFIRAQPMCSFESLLSLSQAIPVTIEHVVIALYFLWCRVYYNDSITRTLYSGASQHRKGIPWT